MNLARTTAYVIDDVRRRPVLGLPWLLFFVYVFFRLISFSLMTAASLKLINSGSAPPISVYRLILPGLKYTPPLLAILYLAAAYSRRPSFRSHAALSLAVLLILAGAMTFGTIGSNALLFQTNGLPVGYSFVDVAFDRLTGLAWAATSLLTGVFLVRRSNWARFTALLCVIVAAIDITAALFRYFAISSLLVYAPHAFYYFAVYLLVRQVRPDELDHLLSERRSDSDTQA